MTRGRTTPEGPELPWREWPPIPGRVQAEAGWARDAQSILMAFDVLSQLDILGVLHRTRGNTPPNTVCMPVPVPQNMSTVKLGAHFTSFEGPLGEEITWGHGSWSWVTECGFLERGLDGSTLNSRRWFQVHLLAPVRRPVTLGAVVGTSGMKGTLMWPLPNGVPSWDSASYLGTAACK